MNKNIIIPPHNEEAEQALLGAILLDYEKIMPKLLQESEELFYKNLHGNIFTAMKSIYPDKIDGIAIKEYFNKHDLIQIPVEYLRILRESINNYPQIEPYLSILKDKVIKREMYYAQLKIQKGLKEDINSDELLEIFNSTLNKILDNKSQGGKDHLTGFNLASNLQNKIYETGKQNEKGEYEFKNCLAYNQQIRTGFEQFDTIFGGFFPGCLIYIGGRPSMGKTTIATKMALNIAKTGNVIFYSFELPEMFYTTRLIGQLNQESSNELLYNKNIYPEIENKLNKLSSSKLITCFRMKSLKEIYFDCLKIKNNSGLKAIFIDRIEYIPDKKQQGETENNRLERLSKELNKIAVNLNVPLICLTQLSRASELRTDNVPQLSDLRNSGALEQDAKQVIFIHRYKNNPDKGLLIMAKNMFGQTGKIDLDFIKEFPDFKEEIKKNEKPN